MAAIPVIQLAPSALKAKQWQKAYSIGVSFAPALSLVSAAAWGYLAYAGMSASNVFPSVPTNIAATAHKESPTEHTKTLLYLGATLFTPSIAPFTIIGMKGINGKLHAKADSLSLTETGVEDGTVGELAEQWKWYNLVRAVLAGTGAVLGLTAVLDLV